MKTVNWDKCKNPGIWTQDPTPKDPNNILIKPNMRVSAKYKGHDISLKIINKIVDNKYKALVTDVRPLNKKRPDDLFTGDEVSIDRDFICTIFECPNLSLQPTAKSRVG